MKFFILLIILSGLALAEDFPKITGPYPTEETSAPVPGTVPPTESPVEEVVDEAIKVTEEEDKTVIQKVEEKITKGTSTKENRKDSIGTVMVGYQLFTSWIPSKKTISYTHIFNEKWSLEGEYAWSSIGFPYGWVDLGEISEKRFSLMARYYQGNSFHFQFGPYYNDFHAHVGNAIAGNISGSRTTSGFGVEGVGVTGGMGNRWQWNNGFTLGIDWIRLNIPLFVTDVDDEILDDVSNEDDKDDIKKVILYLNRIPTYVFLGINLGYSF